jgi:hypothetical protein
MPIPNFFIVGAPKCGTTALYSYLLEHPNIFMSTPKEPHYFLTDMPRKKDVPDAETYFSLFEPAAEQHLAIGEASVWYLYSQEAIKNIKQVNPEARLIAMFRNPADMVYSMHSQHLYGRTETETDFARAWEQTPARKCGQNISRNAREPKLLYYDEIAKYGEQLERLYSYFPREQVKVIFYDDFKKDTRQVFNEVLSFLQLPFLELVDFSPVNQNKRHKLGWLANFTQRPPKTLVKISEGIKTLTGIKELGVMDAFRQINVEEKPREALQPELRAVILENYREDILKLAALTGRDLSHWLGKVPV